MKILIDMNLSPDWNTVFKKYNWTSVHWSSIGNPKASDKEIMQWAVDNNYVVFTHDLDFGAILACTNAEAPSVIQIRTQDTFPETLEPIIVPIMKEYENILKSGALIILDESKMRIRILPLNKT